jgi:hypothetical protein
MSCKTFTVVQNFSLPSCLDFCNDWQQCPAAAEGSLTNCRHARLMVFGPQHTKMHHFQGYHKNVDCSDAIRLLLGGCCTVSREKSTAGHSCGMPLKILFWVRQCADKLKTIAIFWGADQMPSSTVMPLDKVTRMQVSHACRNHQYA